MSRLTVVTSHFNVCHYQSRKRLYEQFAQHMSTFDVRLITVECAFKGQQHEVTIQNNPDHIQVRAEHPVWLKENLLNIGFTHAIRTDPCTEHLAWLDADIEFQNTNWVAETQAALGHFRVIQPWKRVLMLGPNGETETDRFSWGYKYQLDRGIGHSGYGWAIRRTTYEDMGGFIDFTVDGVGDFFFAQGILGQSQHARGGNLSPASMKLMNDWEDRAKTAVDKQFGFIEGDIKHFYHGTINNRGYGTRYTLLNNASFNPLEDLTHNVDGVVQFVGNKPKLIGQFQEYFKSRREDDAI